MRTQQAPWMMDSDFEQRMSRRRFWNVAATVAAIAYSVSYLGTLTILRVTREDAPMVMSEVVIVAEAPSAEAREATSTPAAQKAAEAPPVAKERAVAAAKPMSSKPTFKAWTKRERSRTPVWR